MADKPWHGIVVATATPFRDDLSLDLERVQEHVAWLADNGCHGVTPAGSLGEYQVLSATERRDLVRASVEAAPEGFSVVPGVSAYGADEALAWAEAAAEAGADAVLCQPPNSYRADTRDVVTHFGVVAKAGLPIVTYNNPTDNKVDLAPDMLLRVAEAVPEVVAIKDFSGDVTRAYEMKALTPHIDLIAGMDGVVLELLAAGAVGWLAGFPNSLPRLCARLYDAAVSGDLETALPIYQAVHPLFRWDAHHHFIQAIKASMDAVGRYGGPVRLPRLPLDPETEEEIKALTRELAALPD
ncbi:MAG: dihydrodipicolinate synthase family protein [Acidimicrobiia bacterium]